MKKRIFLGITTLVFGLLLVGCGNKKGDDLPEVINGKNNETKEESNDESTIKLYSTANQLVYNVSDVYYIVVNFDNSGNANGFKWVYNYGSEATASSMVAAIRANMDNETDIKNVTQNGKYITVNYNESAYEGLTYESTKAAFSMYEQVEE